MTRSLSFVLGFGVISALGCQRSEGPKAGRAPKAPIASVAPMGYEEFVGPFASWLDVKSLGAKGDGRADDTDALQRGLDALGVPVGKVPPDDCEAFTDGPIDQRTCAKAKPGHAVNLVSSADVRYVLYLPAGTYRMTRTLRLYDRAFIAVIGEDPATTRLVWDGEAGQGMLLIDGVTHAAWRRLGWDGRGKARAAVHHAFSGAHGGQGGESMEHADEVFENLEYGILAGGPAGTNDADASVRRCQFRGISEAGLSTLHFNALQWHVWDSTFSDCKTGIVNVAGGWSAHNNVFLRSTRADMRVENGMFFGIRNNTSIGSNRFLEDHWLRATSPYLIQGNTIAHPIQDDAVQVNKVGNTLLLDNRVLVARPVSRPVLAYGERFRFPLAAIGPTQKEQRPRSTPGDVVTAGNQLLLDGKVVGDGGAAVSDGRLVALHGSLAAAVRSADPSAMPRTPALALGRAIFDVAPKATAADVQALIDRAERLRGRRPVIHFPAGIFELEATVRIPPGLDLQIVGDSAQSILNWAGPPGAPLMVWSSPARATIRDLSLLCLRRCASALVIETDDMEGGRIFGDGVEITSTTSESFHFRGLDRVMGRFENAAMISVHVTGGGAGATRGVDFIGGGFSGHPAPGVEKFALDRGGRLDLEDAWIEDLPPFTLRGSGDFTLQSAMVAIQRPAKGAGRAEGILVSGFEGTVRFVNVLTTEPIVFDASSRARALLLGVHHIWSPADRARVAMEDVLNAKGQPAGERRKLDSPDDPFGLASPDCSMFFANHGSGRVVALNLRTCFEGALSVECREAAASDPQEVAELLRPLRTVDHRSIIAPVLDARITDAQLHSVTLRGNASSALLLVTRPPGG